MVNIVASNFGKSGYLSQLGGSSVDFELSEQRLGKQSPKVLIVDNDIAFRDIVAEYCEKNGFEVLLAKDGKEGLDIFEKDQSVSAIITDYNMPVMRGDEMATAVKEKALRDGRRVGIILCSANTEVVDSLTKSPDARFEAVLKKPLNFREGILPHLQRILKNTL